jgi:hypothetical protein
VQGVQRERMRGGAYTHHHVVVVIIKTDKYTI